MSQLPQCSKFLSIFSSLELEEMVCGESVLNIDLLEKHTTYSDGYDRSHVVIRRFWKVLRKFTNRQRLLLSEVCLRNSTSSGESGPR